MYIPTYTHGGILIKLKMKQKISLKQNLVNVALSLAVVVIGYLAFKFFNAPTENWFYPIIFFLVLIYLELLNKQEK